MSTQHFFLCTETAAPTARWKQAFAGGTLVPQAQWEGRMADMVAEGAISWVTTSDDDWQQYLTRLVQANPKARVVVVSGVPEVEQGLQALGSGAKGYTHAYAVPELLQEVATVVEHGGLWTGPELLQRLVANTSAALASLPATQNPQGSASATKNAKLWGTLSAREAEVAEKVAEGRSNKEVADKLFITERTVKAHLGAAFEKLELRDRLQLVLFVASIKAQTAGPAKGSA